MSMSDPVADMLTRIRNALMAQHEAVDTGCSKLNVEIARVLKREGYIAGYAVEGDLKKVLRLQLKYVRGHKSVITGIKRISKPGHRRYAKAGRIPKVLGGMGTVILTTPVGVLTDSESREKNVGGEVLCEVW